MPNGRKPTLTLTFFVSSPLFSRSILDIRYIGTWTSLVLPRPSKRATLSVITEISEDSGRKGGIIETLMKVVDGDKIHMTDDKPTGNHFVEIRPHAADTRPRIVDALVVQVEPKQCSFLVKQLAQDFPLGRPQSSSDEDKLSATLKIPSTDLSHLKRVRRTKGATTMVLQLIIGLDCDIDSTESRDTLKAHGPLSVVSVPGRPPSSEVEWKKFNNLWPTVYQPLNWEETQEKELALSSEERQQMKQGMDHIFEHIRTTEQQLPCAIVMDPKASTIISTSWAEAKLQSISDEQNPLATPVLLALQGVSRVERQAAMSLETDEFSKGQYLCTGYDLYCSYEPSVFEAMGCLHFRLRRLTFADLNEESGATSNSPKGNVWHGGCSMHNIHCLPETNHRFRAFRWTDSTIDRKGEN